MAALSHRQDYDFATPVMTIS
ncbi:hypothetical protein CCACVL1_27842 [Corchorus capsularis]|uniref:Uncharacterized protein n=1 Tax=Corchorus capsularis TaxID=210143 RepID=A0A1R3G8G5_COCAP|nr:hypothetical protein CCACVL1_27842 [Corchorus capsularis]